MLSDEEKNRYKRHLLLSEVGERGQERLKNSKVLLIGAGGLGSPVGLYLAAAGVGTIGIVEFDVLDVSNLQRQVIHSTEWIGKPKADSAAARIRALNPNVAVRASPDRLAPGNIMERFAEYDVVVIATDNYPTRYMAADACHFLDNPFVHGAIYKFEGQATTFVSQRGPCYRCLYPDAPTESDMPGASRVGILGVLPGVIGCIQATEALKVIVGVGRTLEGRLLTYDALAMSFREYKVMKDPDCPLCGPNATIRKVLDRYE